MKKTIGRSHRRVRRMKKRPVVEVRFARLLIGRIAERRPSLESVSWTPRSTEPSVEGFV